MLQTLLKSLKQAASGFSIPHTSHKVVLGPALAAADLSSKLGFTWDQAQHKWQPSQIALQLRQGAPGNTEVGADLGLHLQGVPEPAHPVDSFRHCQSTPPHHLHK